jgi:hypothetical protein
MTYKLTDNTGTETIVTVNSVEEAFQLGCTLMTHAPVKIELIGEVDK